MSARSALPSPSARARGVQPAWISAPLGQPRREEISSAMGCRPDPRRLSSMHGGMLNTGTSPAPRPSTFSIRSLSFCVFPSPDAFSPEWTREGRGVDRVWFETRAKDRKMLLVVRMWDAGGPTMMEAEAASSVRVVIEVDAVDQCRSTPGGVSLYLRLSRPPIFETVAARTPYQPRPFPLQVSSFDTEHARVVGYASRALRLEMRTRADFTAFLFDAERVGLPRVITTGVIVALDPAFDDEALAIFQSWLLALDFRVAFQLEKLVHNGLVVPGRALSLRDLIDAYVVNKGVRETERILALFADQLSDVEPQQEAAGAGRPAEEKENEAPVALSSPTPSSTRVQRRKTEPFVSALDDDRRRKRRKTEPAILSLDSSGTDDLNDDDNVVVVGATLPYYRGISTRDPTHLSLPDLRTLLGRAATDSVSLGQLLVEATESQLVRQVTITPTRLLLAGPFLCDTNTIMRGSGQPQNFLTVAVRAEDGSRLNDRNTHLLESRFKPIFRNGFELGGRSWRFLAWSSSGLKSGSCFFVSPHTHEGQAVTPETIHRSIGDFIGTETAMIPAKYMARIAQAFSSSTPTLELDSSQIIDVLDIESR